MPRLNLKPISVNEAYRGRRYSTQKLKDYKNQIALLAPKIKVPEGKLVVRYIFGVSSKGSDGDNLIKALQDALAEKYGFNDNRIYAWYIEKEDVKKGEEYIDFTIHSFV